MKPVTIQDISNKLSISRNTISRVLNGKAGVLPQTQELIIKTAKEMGYYKLKASVANSVSDAKGVYGSKVILMLTMKDDSKGFCSSITSGAYEEFLNTPYSLVYGEVKVLGDGTVSMPSIVTSGTVDGIIVVNVKNETAIKEIVNLKVPKVYYDSLIGYTPSILNGDVICVDGVDSIKRITQHMFNSGCENIAFIGDIHSSKSAYDRWQGFCIAHEEIGMSVDKSLCFTSDPYRFSKRQSIEDVLSTLSCVPDAIVCIDDQIAGAVIATMQVKNPRLYENVMVSGHGDIEYTSFTKQYFTTASVSNEYIGKRIASQIIWRIKESERIYEEIRVFATVQFRKNSENR